MGIRTVKTDSIARSRWRPNECENNRETELAQRNAEQIEAGLEEAKVEPPGGGQSRGNLGGAT